MKILSVLFLLFFLPTASPGAEPKQEETLEPVVVTATRIETPLKEVTNSISVITAKDIEEQQSVTVLDALRNVPGLDVVQTGSRGNSTSVFIRGSESDQILVLVDGVEVNSTTQGSFNFAHLTTENVERIEVLRGAGGTLYGSQAIGGVIQIFTKSGKGKPEVTTSIEGGNGYTHRQALTLGGKAKRLGYFFSASRLETDGFRSFNDDYQTLNTSVRLDYNLTEDSALKGIFQFVKTDLGLFNSNNFIAGATDPNARQALSQYLGKLEWQQRIQQGWNYRISGSIFKEHIKNSDDPEPGSFDTRTRSRFRPQIGTAEMQTNYRFGEWSFSYRSDPSRRLYQRLRYSPQTFFDGTRTDWSAALGVRATSSFAAEGQFQRSTVDGPWGAFVADLVMLRFDLALSPEMTLRTLSQYNSSTDSVSTSVRFNWIYSPGSDLYVAYDELRVDIPGVPWLSDRQLAIKMTYLFSR